MTLSEQLRRSLEGKPIPPVLPCTLSKLELAVECLHSFTLDLPEERGGYARGHGSAFHEHAAKTIRFRTPAPLPMVETWWATVRDHIPASAHVELAVAWNPDRGGRVLGHDIGRAYAQHGGTADELCGSLDVAWRDGSTLHIRDHKTGRRYHYAADSWQLRGGAVVLASAWRGIERAHVEYHYVNETGGVTVDAADISAEDLQHTEATMRRVHLDWLRNETLPRPGEHCDRLYCRARDICGGYRAHQRSIHAKEHEPMTISLASVTRGVVEEPFSVVLYGPEGVGKSTWAASAPNPIFICEPRGTNRIDTARFPNLTSWEDIKAALAVLKNEKHDYKTVVIDTADWVEGLIWEDVCRKGKKATISDFGYGKGYDSAREEIRWMLARLDELHSAGMNTLVLAHAHIKRFEDPTSDGYDVYELRMNQKSAELIRAWPNALLFANYRVYLNVNADEKRKAVTDGARVVFTQPHPARHAKNRYGLPDEIPLDWAEFEAAARKGTPAAAAELEASIAQLIEQLTNGRAEEAKKALKRDAGNPHKLARLRDKVISSIQSQSQKENAA